ncbi:MAG: hypothetical protein QXR59_00850 [Candidatus Bathyarchaeia archaeon]
MESEIFKRFLETESRRAPIERKQSGVGERFWLFWGESKDRAEIKRGTSDIIDSLYFGEEPSRTVVIDRRVARMLQERIKGLEEENLRLYKHIRIMKFIILTLLLAVFGIIIMLLM